MLTIIITPLKMDEVMCRELLHSRPYKEKKTRFVVEPDQDFSHDTGSKDPRQRKSSVVTLTRMFERVFTE